MNQYWFALWIVPKFFQKLNRFQDVNLHLLTPDSMLFEALKLECSLKSLLFFVFRCWWCSLCLSESCCWWYLLSDASYSWCQSEWHEVRPPWIQWCGVVEQWNFQFLALACEFFSLLTSVFDFAAIFHVFVVGGVVGVVGVVGAGGVDEKISLVTAEGAASICWVEWVAYRMSILFLLEWWNCWPEKLCRNSQNEIRPMTDDIQRLHKKQWEGISITAKHMFKLQSMNQTSRWRGLWHQ